MSDKVKKELDLEQVAVGVKRNLLLDVLVLLFGVSAWLGINSTYVQLPLLVQDAPEGWSLPSYMVIVIQLANLSPLLYTLLQRWQLLNESIYITALLVIGAVGAIVFGFVYDLTTKVGGEDRSLALLTILFGFALVGCTSSVLFMPYMGRFKEMYLITYLIGEGVSGFLPSLVALVQGIGGNAKCIPSEEGEFEYYTPPPRFGVQSFYIFVAVIFVIGVCAFVLIDRLPAFKKEYSAVEIKTGNEYAYSDEEEAKQRQQDKLNRFDYVYLMILMSVICFFTNGFFPSIQSYSCLPYGNVAYHLTVTFTAIANPAACFLAFFLPHKSVRLVSVLTVFATFFAAYALATSMMSPPPLMDSGFGSTLVIICWTILTGLHSFVRLSINTIYRQQGGKALVYIGGSQQIGSFLGSIVAFTLVNYTNIFKQYDPCSKFYD